MNNKGETLVDPENPGKHNLYEIDYAARTVRARIIDADGAPLTIQGYTTPDTTSPAQISDNEIKWGRSSSYFTLGRYSGKLTWDALVGGNVGWKTFWFRCQPYAALKRQKKF